MKRALFLAVLAVLMTPAFLHAQSGQILIPAGTPEDQALQKITAEQDPQKKLTMYEDFVGKFSSSPAAVAYGNWQIAQYYRTAGDTQKALDYGDKALAAAPKNLDLLVFLASVAQDAKNNAKTFDYAVQGGEAYNSALKKAGAGNAASTGETNPAKSSYEFLEAAAYNVIVGENDAKTRMAYIERFTPAFPNSRFADAVASFAMVSLSQLNDMSRLVAYGDKTLAADPNSLPTLLLLAGAYADDSKPGSAAKAVTYAKRAIDVAKPDAPDADASRKLSAGMAYSTLGYAYMKQDKTAAAVPELKSALPLLKGNDQQLAVALYRLGFAYAKLNRVTEAREVLQEAVKIPGPVHQLCEDLLAKVNAARARRR
jgi:tetratricopeptide (TPR) repeat protein